MSISYTKQPKEGSWATWGKQGQWHWSPVESREQSSRSTELTTHLICLTKHPPLLPGCVVLCAPRAFHKLPQLAFSTHGPQTVLSLLMTLVLNFSFSFFFFWGVCVCVWVGGSLCIVLELDGLELTDIHLPMHSTCLVYWLFTPWS